MPLCYIKRAGKGLLEFGVVAYVDIKEDGAGDGTRTRECKLGKLMPYHLATPAC